MRRISEEPRGCPASALGPQNLVRLKRVNVCAIVNFKSCCDSVWQLQKEIRWKK